MTGWQIDPAGVERVRVAQETWVRRWPRRVLIPPAGEVVVVPGGDRGIPEALGMVLESRLGEFEAIVNHVTAGIAGVTAASNTYLDAQSGMDTSVRAAEASEVEGEMIRAAETGTSLSSRTWQPGWGSSHDGWVDRS